LERKYAIVCRLCEFFFHFVLNELGYDRQDSIGLEQLSLS